MMEDFLPIYLGLVLFFLFTSTVNLRLYFRTQLRSLLLISLGGIADIVGLTGGFIWLTVTLEEGEFNIWGIPFLILIIIGGMLGSSGIMMQASTESGRWKDICEKTSFWQRLLGDVPPIEKKEYPSVMSKRLLLFVGSSLMLAGVLCIISLYLFDILTISHNLFIGLLVASIGSIIDGLLLVIFTIAQKDADQ